MAGYIASFSASLRTLIGLPRHGLAGLQEAASATVSSSPSQPMSGIPSSCKAAEAEVSKAAKAEETVMSVASVLQTVDNDVKGFFLKLTADYKKAKQAWTLLSSPEVRSVLLRIGGDVVKLVKDAGAAGSAGGLSVPLDAALVQDVTDILADAKAGEGVLIADLKVLGITL